MSTAPNNTGRRWALSPIDSRSHLLAEQDGAPVGMLVARCGRLLPCSVDTSPHPPAGLRCPACARAASQACAQLPVPARGGQPDPVRGSDPAMHWARCPTDGCLHAIAPTDTEQAATRGYAEALCGHRLPAGGLVVQDVPSGALCLPCVIGVTTDMEDPGRMGTAF